MKFCLLVVIIRRLYPKKYRKNSVNLQNVTRQRITLNLAVIFVFLSANCDVSYFIFSLIIPIILIYSQAFIGACKVVLKHYLKILQTFFSILVESL